MRGLAELELIGNVVKIEENTNMGRGKPVWNVSIAVNRNQKDGNGGWNEVTDWYNCQWWSPPEGVLAKLKKGDPVRALCNMTQRVIERDNRKTTFYNYSIQSLFALPRWIAEQEPKVAVETATDGDIDFGDESEIPF